MNIHDTVKRMESENSLKAWCNEISNIIKDENDDDLITIKPKIQGWESILEEYLSGIEQCYELIKRNCNDTVSESELKEFIRLSYRRNLWTEDYAKTTVTDGEINDYYKDYVIGDIEASHILIKSNATKSMSDSEKKDEEEKALKLAKEIIAKLDKGEKFEDLAKEYSDDDATSEKGGKLGSFNDRSNYDKNFLEGAIKLKVNEYSKTPVKSQYGYHIIYKTKQNDKPELDKVKDAVIAKIANEKVTNDSTFASKAMISLRQKYEMKITDSKLSSKYDSIYNK